MGLGGIMAAITASIRQHGRGLTHKPCPRSPDQRRCGNPVATGVAPALIQIKATRRDHILNGPSKTLTSVVGGSSMENVIARLRASKQDFSAEQQAVSKPVGDGPCSRPATAS